MILDVVGRSSQPVRVIPHAANRQVAVKAQQSTEDAGQVVMVDAEIRLVWRRRRSAANGTATTLLSQSIDPPLSVKPETIVQLVFPPEANGSPTLDRLLIPTSFARAFVLTSGDWDEAVERQILVAYRAAAGLDLIH